MYTPGDILKMRSNSSASSTQTSTLLRRVLNASKWAVFLREIRAGFLPRGGFLAVIGVILSVTAFHAIPLQGKWLDRAFSDSLSRKYNQSVRVERVRIFRLFTIRFGSLKVDTPDGPPLIHATSGAIQLRKISLNGGPRVEFEMLLNQADFFREYYKNSPSFNQPLSFLMHKPLHVRSINLYFVEKGGWIELKILRAISSDLRLSGQLDMNDKGVIRDRIAASFSPLEMLRAIL